MRSLAEVGLRIYRLAPPVTGGINQPEFSNAQSACRIKRVEFLGLSSGRLKSAV